MTDTNVAFHFPNWLLPFIQLVASTVLIPSAFALIRRLSAIRDTLDALNQRIVELSQWRRDYESLQATIHENHGETRRQCREWNHREFGALWAAIRQRRPPDDHEAPTQ